MLEQQGFLKTGLTKLAEAEGTVDELSAKAGAQREELRLKKVGVSAAVLCHVCVRVCVCACVWVGEWACVCDVCWCGVWWASRVL